MSPERLYLLKRAYWIRMYCHVFLVICRKINLVRSDHQGSANREQVLPCQLQMKESNHLNSHKKNNFLLLPSEDTQLCACVCILTPKCPLDPGILGNFLQIGLQVDMRVLNEVLISSTALEP